MLQRIVAFCSLCLIIISCASNKRAVKDNEINRGPVCAGVIPVRPTEKKPRADYRFELEFAVRNNDTTYLSELICLDSVKLTEVLNKIKASPICLEMGEQGITYFLAETNKYGGFENVKVIRPAAPCFKHLQEEVKLKVGKMRILQEEHFSSVIIFRYLYFIQ